MRFFYTFSRLMYVENTKDALLYFYVPCALGGYKMLKNKMDLLVVKAKNRDPDAFTELIQTYMKDMYKTAIAILMNDEDAADAIQETILTCWEKIGTLQHNNYFKTWLIRILINNCYDIRKAREKISPLEEFEEPSAEDSYNLELKEALSCLDEKYRIVMMLYYGEGYLIHEIAELLKIPKSTVQTRLDRGRKKLKSYFIED